MVDKLRGRVVIVTGAAQGQGAAIARALVEAGASVLLADVKDAPGAALAAELGDRARYTHLDVSSESEWSAAAKFAQEAFGKVDGLVNNAGILKFGPLLETSLEDWNAVIGVDQTGVFLGMRTVAPLLIDAGGGTIVNTTSTSSYRGLPGIAAYVAAKFAVRGLTKVAAIELGKHGIRVNAIAPGAIDTPMSASANTAGWAAQSKQQYTDVPLGRKGTPSEIAQAVVFLTSDDSSFCTGAELLVDGGALAGPVHR